MTEETMILWNKRRLHKTALASLVRSGHLIHARGRFWSVADWRKLPELEQESTPYNPSLPQGKWQAEVYDMLANLPRGTCTLEPLIEIITKDAHEHGEGAMKTVRLSVRRAAVGLVDAGIAEVIDGKIRLVGSHAVP